MPNLSFDTANVASAGKPLPEGDYAFEIEDATMKVSAKGDSYNLKLRLVVTSENENGRIHSENLNVQEKTLPFVKAFLTKLWGVEDEDIPEMNFDVDEDDGTLNSINGRPIVGSAIGGTIKHIQSGDSVYGNVVAWITV